MAATLRYIAYKRADGKWGVGLWHFRHERIVDPLAGAHETERKAQRIADKMNTAMSVISLD